MHEPVDYPRHPAPFASRTVLAAAHVVADIRGEYTPGVAPPVDWEATIAFRKHLFTLRDRHRRSHGHHRTRARAA